MSRIAVLLVLVSFVFWVSVADEVDSSCEKRYIVVATSLNVRLHPSPDSEIVRKIKKHTRVCAYHHKNEWIRIDRGWVSEEHVSPLETVPMETHNMSSRVFMSFSLLVLLFVSAHGMVFSFKNRNSVLISIYATIILTVLGYMLVHRISLFGLWGGCLIGGFPLSGVRRLA